jgi:hypothetical protein
VSTTGTFEVLKELETELHRLETRRNVARLNELLDPDFEEFGRSGRNFSREEILQEFSDITEFPKVVAQNFRLHEIGEHAALLTYTSAHVGPSGELHRFTNRSSVWVRGIDGWKMRFHQGTPTDG